MRRSIIFFVPALLMMTLMVCLFGGTANAATAQTHTTQHHLHLFPTRPASQQRAAAANTPAPPYGSGDLIYNGGPVEETPRVFLIFWGTTWNNGSGGLTQAGQIVQSLL